MNQQPHGFSEVELNAPIENEAVQVLEEQHDPLSFLIVNSSDVGANIGSRLRELSVPPAVTLVALLVNSAAGILVEERNGPAVPLQIGVQERKTIGGRAQSVPQWRKGHSRGWS